MTGDLHNTDLTPHLRGETSVELRKIDLEWKVERAEDDFCNLIFIRKDPILEIKFSSTDFDNTNEPEYEYFREV